MTGRATKILVLCTAFFCAIVSIGAAPAFNPKPWLEDLDQAQRAFATKYSDLEWEVVDREIDLSKIFADTRVRIEAAQSDADARAAFDRLVRKIDDGHVAIDWPQTKSANAGGEEQDRCTALGFNPAMFARPLAALAPSYRAIPSPAEFPSGLLDVGGRKVGVLKIGLFFPDGTPALCKDALAALKIDPKKTCDDSCSDRIEDWATLRMTQDLLAALRALDAAGASALVVDIAGNGGGTEWAEAAMRMLTPVRLKSERVGFARGEHWATELGQSETDIRKAAKTASPGDRAFLLALADDAAAKRKVALTPCDSAPLWKGGKPDCEWLGNGFFGSGMIDSADPERLKGKSWAQLVFSPAQFAYEEGAWKKPLVVLIDTGTGSASSQFAAVLQDNHAAILMGAPASGGCGHTNGGTPTTLSNSRAVLSLPDCVRFGADGTNEFGGIEPDVLVGFTPGDGPHRRAEKFFARLPEALRLADSR